MLNIYINGKFLSQRITGVQRYAREVLNSLDVILSQDGCWGGVKCILVVPFDAEVPGLKSIEVLRSSKGAGHFWEQFVLPTLCKDGVLLSLSGSAPLFKVRQYCTMHDAVLFEYPGSYSWKFVLWYRFLFNWLSFSAKHVFTVSQFSCDRLSYFLPMLKNKISVVNNGSEHFNLVQTDLSILEKFGLVGKPFFLIVGSKNPSKNLQGLSRVVSDYFSCGDYLFVMAGDANPKVFGEDRLKLPSNVIAVGYVSDSELKALYESARAFVFPSLYEGFGIPLLEAMTAGCPIVCSNRASMPEVCGDAAIYFDPQNEVDMRRAMEHIWLDSEYSAELRKKGFNRAVHFSWQDSAEKILNTIIHCEQDL